MAASFVTLFQWKLNSVLLQENEILLGVKHGIESLITQLDTVQSSTGDVGRILGRESCSHGSWASELRGELHQAEDFVDDFIVKAYGKTDEKDLEDPTAEFGKELENINCRVSEILNRKPPVEASVMVGEIRSFLRSNFVYDEGNETDLVSCMLNYINLPYDLKLSLLFCRAFLGRYEGTIDGLLRVLVAAGLVKGEPEGLMEDKAHENIEKLISLGMIEDLGVSWDHFKVSSPFFELSLRVMEAEDFNISIVHPNSMVLPTDSPLHYLFVSAKNGLSEASSSRLETLLHNAKFLRVLDLNNTRLKSLPDEVGKLVHLRYLGVRHSNITKLPDGISNLRNLQTLDVYRSGHEFELSSGVLNLAQLRHLTIYRPYNDGEVRVPLGIFRLRNLQTLEGIYAGGGIAKELGIMTQLRSLHVRYVSDDHADELYVSIMKLIRLQKLSVSVERERKLHNPYSLLWYENSIFPCLESFTPPPLLQTLELVGRLVELPVWLGSMEKLTKLHICYSHLSENPTTVLQLLPNLKYLQMAEAYKGKRMGKEFFRAGGFPSLEYLRITSRVLVEWTEMEEGALPCLKHLSFRNCLRLLVLPEGLQHVTTLQTLRLHVQEDLIRRLSPDGGPENYKIKHIPSVTYIGHTFTSQGVWRR